MISACSITCSWPKMTVPIAALAARDLRRRSIPPRARSCLRAFRALRRLPPCRQLLVIRLYPGLCRVADPGRRLAQSVQHPGQYRTPGSRASARRPNPQLPGDYAISRRVRSALLQYFTIASESFRRAMRACCGFQCHEYGAWITRHRNRGANGHTVTFKANHGEGRADGRCWRASPAARAGEAPARGRRRCICGIRRSAAISTCESPPTAPGSTWRRRSAGRRW